MKPIGAHGDEVMRFENFCFKGQLGFLNCDDICMCVLNKQFELLEFVIDSVYVDLQYDEISLAFTSGFVCLCGLCNHVVVFGLSERLSCGCGGCGDRDACTLVLIYSEGVSVRG